MICSYHSLDFAIEQDLLVTMVDCLPVIVVDLIANDFVLVDLFVDQKYTYEANRFIQNCTCKMGNVVAVVVVVVQQVRLVDIAIVVVNVVLNIAMFIFNRRTNPVCFPLRG